MKEDPKMWPLSFNVPRPGRRAMATLITSAMILTLTLGGLTTMRGQEGNELQQSATSVPEETRATSPSTTGSPTAQGQVPGAASPDPSIPPTTAGDAAVPEQPEVAEGQIILDPAQIGQSVTPPTAPGAPVAPAPQPLTRLSSGFSLALAPAGSSAEMNKKMKFTAFVQDPLNELKSLSWSFGDGESHSVDASRCNASGESIRTVPGKPTSVVVDHTYSTPGTFQIRASALLGSCTSAQGDQTVTATASAVVTSPPPDPPTNGAQPPTVSIERSPDSLLSDPKVAVNLQSTDPDGFISQIVVDWDDSTTPSAFTYPVEQCNKTGNKHPETSRSERAEHTYTSGGSYSVTVTVTSISCDGTDPQQAVGVIDIASIGSDDMAGLPPSPSSVLASIFF